MNHWKRLDLRGKSSVPPPDALAVLYLEPLDSRAVLSKADHYEIGCFQKCDDSRKVWWNSGRSVVDPVKLQTIYKIWWHLEQEFDGG